MGVPMLISKHALNCSKGSANREKYKNKSHLFFTQVSDLDFEVEFIA